VFQLLLEGEVMIQSTQTEQDVLDSNKRQMIEPLSVSTSWFIENGLLSNRKTGKLCIVLG